MDVGAWLHYLPRGKGSLEEDLEPAWVNLYCFPHAGGGEHAYAAWGDILSKNVQCVAVNMPGRGSRMAEPAVSDLPTLVGHIADAVFLDPAPAAFFGHSFGAIVAFEVAVELKRRGCKGPSIIFASSHRAPTEYPDDKSRLGDIDDDEALLATSQQFGLLSDAEMHRLAKSPDLLSVVLPPLRNDLKMARDYAGCSVQLDAPIVALGGDSDAWCATSDLSGWGRLTTNAGSGTTAAAVNIFPGGHFYFSTKRRGSLSDSNSPPEHPPQLMQLLDLVGRELASTVARLPRSVCDGGDDDYNGDVPYTVNELFMRQVRTIPSSSSSSSLFALRLTSCS